MGLTMSVSHWFSHSHCSSSSEFLKGISIIPYIQWSTKTAISLQVFASHEIGVAVFTCMHAKSRDSWLIKLVRQKKKATSTEIEKLQQNGSITGKLKMEKLALVDRIYFWSEYWEFYNCKYQNNSNRREEKTRRFLSYVSSSRKGLFFS